MRIRSTKPEFWRSKTIAQLDWETRLVLKAIESYVDDNGVGKDSLVIFCADAFPHDLAKSPEICAKVSRSLSRLSDANLIARYSIAGEDLVYVRRWKKWQYIDKPKAGRYQRPDGTMNYRDEVDESIGAGQGVTDPVAQQDSPDSPENFAKTARKVPEECPQIQSGEQGNRGSEEQEKPPYPPAEFEPSPEQPRTRKTGAEIARSKFSVVPTGGSQLAGQIVRAYGESLGTPVEAKTSREMSTVIDSCLQAGQSPDAIAAGIQLWEQSDSWSPSQIPKFITKAAASRRHNGVGKPTQQAVVTQNLAAEIIAEMDQP